MTIKNRYIGSARILVQCFPYLADWLQLEIEQLGYAPERVERTAVWISGTMKDAMRLNYSLRTANRVLMLLEEFKASTPDHLYRELLRIRWEEIIPNNGYISIHGFIRNEHIRDNRFAFMRVKDAIVDRIADKTGKRPDSGPDLTNSVVYIHWVDGLAAVYLDTSGETIAKHGYRRIPFKAPVMESLASAIILASKWNSNEAFINPMCGSGTLAIEAALMAKGDYPGKFRDNFGFMHVNGFDRNEWDKIKQAFDQTAKANKPVIIASDHDPEAIIAARKNARAAGVEDMITFEKCDFSETTIPEGPGIVVMNPEYGERLGVTKSLEKVYSDIGDFLKNRCPGKRGYVFTGNTELSKKVGLRTSRKIPFLNARIECRLLEYELYAGSRKKE